jgi:hypothetical protein
MLKLFGASETLLSVIHALLGIVSGGLILMVAGLFLAASLPQDSASTPPQHPLLNRK